MLQLGCYAKDRITGFEGTVTGMVTYISGCNQALLVPKVGADGAARASEWFDQQRLVVDQRVRPVVLDNGPTPGHDRAPPKR